MMNFKLPFEIPSSDLQLDTDSKMVFLGSCFADNISEKLDKLQLQIESNPFGTLFHPEPIAYQLQEALTDGEEVDILQRGNVFLDWMSAGKIAAPDKDKLVDQVLSLRSSLKEQLRTGNLLVISFGTAWGYSRNDLNKTVGNCHKQPGGEFEKVLFDPIKALNDWKHLLSSLNAFNPELKIVLTVSPVRHAKDGLVENNRSKARLIEFVHTLCEEKNVYYFPAYEILIDELRDYRFYANDLVHPNSLAIDYIFEKFLSFAFHADAIKDIQELNSYIQLRDHKVLHSFSEEEVKRQDTLEKRRAELIRKHPWIGL